jgi:DNA repair protein RadA/Sms
MPKLKTIYVCQQCAYQAVRWAGRCPRCEAWNALVEELLEPAAAASPAAAGVLPAPMRLAEVTLDDAERLRTGLEEFDRVVGGGLVPGSVTLVGGDPGIGKSTLLLSVVGRLSAAGRKVLYVSGEESLQQTKLRAERLGLGASAIQLLAHTQLEAVAETIRRLAPAAVVVDSIQVMQTDALASAPGSIGQVRACAQALVRLAKERAIAVFLIGHVTKDGFLAGPKVLEHLVDTVLYVEGEPASGFRVLRSIKNRFGATHELGVFQMTSDGLLEVANPSELFLGDREEAVPGCMVTASLEGSRPLLVEVQALTSPCGIGLPRRRTTGVDVNRLSMLLAVLERRVGLRQVAQQDVFVSSLGGVRIVEPAADLGIALAIASAVQDRPTARGDLAIGEVGLTGEVRPVAGLTMRIHEAKRIGFLRCLVAAGRDPAPHVDGLTVIPVRHVREAVARALEGA